MQRCIPPDFTETSWLRRTVKNYMSLPKKIGSRSLLKHVIAAFAVAVWSMSFVSVCGAHNLNYGYSYVHISSYTADFELLLPFPVLLQYDLDNDKKISQEELDAQRNQISDYMKEHLLLYNGYMQMKFELTGLKATVQKSTEDPVVAFTFKYTSDADIGTLTIKYDAIIRDADPYHQNYIQIYKDGMLAGHHVVGKDDPVFRFAPGSQMHFSVSLLGGYLLEGVRHVIRSADYWLFLLSAFYAARSLRKPLEWSVIAAAAGMIGFIAADRSGVTVAGAWGLLPLFGMIGWLVLRRMKGKESGNLHVFAALFGFVHGGASVSTLLQDLGIVAEYKIVSVICYESGILAGLAALSYVLASILTPMLHFRRRGSFTERAHPNKSF